MILNKENVNHFLFKLSLFAYNFYIKNIISLNLTVIYDMILKDR